MKYPFFLIFVILLLTNIQLSGCKSSRRTQLDKGREIAKPVLDALDEFLRTEGRYPTSLDSLIEQQYLPEIPVLTRMRGTLGVEQLEYNVAPDGSFFLLRFGYDFSDGIGPPEFISEYYISDTSAWRSSSNPPSFEGIMSERYGRRFQTERTRALLEITIDTMINSS